LSRKRDFVFGAAVEEIEDRARDAALGHAAQIGDRIGLRDVGHERRA
jgi:hypothetical protein